MSTLTRELDVFVISCELFYQVFHLKKFYIFLSLNDLFGVMYRLVLDHHRVVILLDLMCGLKDIIRVHV